MLQAFVYSSKPLIRFARHLLFWLGFFIYRFIESLPLDPVRVTPEYCRQVLFYGLSYLPVLLFFIYSGLYLILPRFIKRLQFRNAILVTAFCWLVVFASAYILNGIIFPAVLHETTDLSEMIRDSDYFSVAVTLPFFVTALAIKMTKEYITKEKETQALSEGKMQNALRLMKSKWQPAILQEALLNIQRDIRGTYENAPSLVLRLSEFLHYILYESDAERVSLRRELSMMRDYIGLKSGSSIERHIPVLFVSGKIGDRQILPLISLPLLDIIYRESEDAKGLRDISIRWDLSEVMTALSLTRSGGMTLPSLDQADLSVLNATRSALEVSYPGRHRLNVRETDRQLTITMELGDQSMFHVSA